MKALNTLLKSLGHHTHKNKSLGGIGLTTGSTGAKEDPNDTKTKIIPTVIQCVLIINGGKYLFIDAVYKSLDVHNEAFFLINRRVQFNWRLGARQMY